MKVQTIIVGRRESGQPLGKVLRARLGWSWSQVRQALGEGRVHLNANVCRNAAHKVTKGLRLQVYAGALRPRLAVARTPPKPAYSGPWPIIVYADAQVLVVDKPAGLTTMRHPGEAAAFGRRARRFLPPTLADLLPG